MQFWKVLIRIQYCMSFVSSANLSLSNDQALERRVPITRMTSVAACLDPGVRSLILNDDECRELLLETFEELKQSM